MADPTDVVGVLRIHLEEAADALEWSAGHFEALDIADSYRQGRATPRPSRIAAKTGRAKEMLQAYLTPPEEPNGG